MRVTPGMRSSAHHPAGPFFTDNPHRVRQRNDPPGVAVLFVFGT